MQRIFFKNLIAAEATYNLLNTAVNNNYHVCELHTIYRTQ